MSRKEELLRDFRKELSLRNYADNSIDTYAGYLGKFFDAMNGKPKPLPLECIKDFLLSITNMNTRSMYVNSIRNFYNLILSFFAASLIITSNMLDWLRSFFSANNLRSFNASSERVKDVFILFMLVLFMRYK